MRTRPSYMTAKSASTAAMPVMIASDRLAEQPKMVVRMPSTKAPTEAGACAPSELGRLAPWMPSPHEAKVRTPVAIPSTPTIMAPSEEHHECAGVVLTVHDGEYAGDDGGEADERLHEADDL